MGLVWYIGNSFTSNQFQKDVINLKRVCLDFKPLKKKNCDKGEVFQIKFLWYLFEGILISYQIFIFRNLVYIKIILIVFLADICI